MEEYCVNKNAQSNGDHEVHNLATCKRLPQPQNRKHLGKFGWCMGAVQEAKKTYAKVNGCYCCCRECHTR